MVLATFPSHFALCRQLCSQLAWCHHYAFLYMVNILRNAYVSVCLTFRNGWNPLLPGWPVASVEGQVSCLWVLKVAELWSVPYISHLVVFWRPDFMLDMNVDGYYQRKYTSCNPPCSHSQQCVASDDSAMATACFKDLQKFWYVFFTHMITWPLWWVRIHQKIIWTVK